MHQAQRTGGPTGAAHSERVKAPESNIKTTKERVSQSKMQ